ncbi:MAG TPA: DUF6325 family protein [Nocardioides sp.]|jgi:hypothetical protein|nr:DUF6325 family protein [Nocardioides sp.]
MTEQTTQGQDDLIVGPIDYLAVEFPGAKLNGDGLRILVDLVERGIIRILDLRLAVVEANGDITAVEITDLDGDGTLDLAVFSGARSGLLGDDDLMDSASLVEPGNAVGLLLYENTWAGPFVAALRRADAEVIASGRIPAADVIAMLDELDEAEQGA